MFYISKQAYLGGRESGLFPAPVAFDTEPNTDEWCLFQAPEIPDADLFFIDTTMVSEEPFQLEFQAKLKPIDQLKSQLVKKITERYELELCRGITLPSGAEVQTTLEDRAIISALQTTLSLNPELEFVDFKAENGWTKIRRQDAEDLYSLVTAHINLCTRRLAVLTTEVNAASTAKKAYDLYLKEINKGWE